MTELSELKKLITEFGKIGNNLNQIARHFNTGGIHSLEMRKAIGQGLSDIFKMKEEMLKMVGIFKCEKLIHKYFLPSKETSPINDQSTPFH